MENAVLRKSVMVARAGAPSGSPLKQLAAGTPARSIDPVELAQLHPQHFTLVDDADRPTGEPVDSDELLEATIFAAVELRELAGTPGVDSVDHVDPSEVTK